MNISLTTEQIATVRQALTQACGENLANASEAREIEDYDFARGFTRLADLQWAVAKVINTHTQGN